MDWYLPIGHAIAAFTDSPICFFLLIVAFPILMVLSSRLMAD